MSDAHARLQAIRALRDCGVIRKPYVAGDAYAELALDGVAVALQTDDLAMRHYGLTPGGKVAASILFKPRT